MAKNHSQLTKKSQVLLARKLSTPDLEKLARAANDVTQEEYTRIEDEMIKKYGLKVR
ncbi:MAG: hypothetical protein ABSE07_02360 [Methanoregula sp.]|jgi:hypothetical protein